MTRNCVVVPTYPAHFYQTALTLHSIRQHMLPSARVIVLADTLSNLATSEYLQWCLDVYCAYQVEVIPASITRVANQFISYPWIRQQMIKLHLDQILDCDHWTCIDGDTRLLAPLPLTGRFGNRVRYEGVPLDLRDPGPGEKTSQTIFYVRHVMQDHYLGFRDDQGTYITASQPPIRDMSATVLQSLRSHVNRLHGNFVNLHLSIAEDPRYSVSEWELLEWHYQHYLGNPADWILDQSYFANTWQSDRELGLDWFTEHQLKIDPKIWNQLPLVKYL